MFNIFLCIL